MLFFRVATAALYLLLVQQRLFVSAYAPLQGVKVTGPSSASIDVGDWCSKNGRSLLVFGTYAADFNAIEYGQRLRYYWPRLRDEKGVERCAFLLNCQRPAAEKLVDLLDLPSDIDIWVDSSGQAGRTFGVQRGWLPDEEEINPFLKLFGMLWGLGAWATLPAVIGGYIGNPFRGQPWIEDAMTVGIQQGRWPDSGLELSSTGNVETNKFAELPIVGGWPRRPLELATLRLQSMLGVSLQHWSELAPDEEALRNGVLTQLGGCLVVDNGEAVFDWKDPGICAVANFEDMLEKL